MSGIRRLLCNNSMKLRSAPAAFVAGLNLLSCNGFSVANHQHQHHPFRRMDTLPTRLYSASSSASAGTTEPRANGEWTDILPTADGSHRSSRITIPSTVPTDADDPFAEATFRNRLEATIAYCREMKKTSLWIEVPMARSALIESMSEFGLEFHHTRDGHVVLNVWLQDSESKIPEFATHNVGVGAVVINSRNEILCVRELRNNFMKWKTPTGLSELGEQIDEAICREVLEETGVDTSFHSVLGFRQTHGLANGRSDLYFVCRCDPVERVDEDGNAIIPQPVPQADEIATAEWVPFADYRDMVNGSDGSMGHPMMKHIVKVLEAGQAIDRSIVESVVPGRAPNAMYYPIYDEPIH